MKSQAKRLLSRLFSFFFDFMMSLRYRVEVKGLKELVNQVGKDGKGVLFLPNHPTVLVDPTLVSLVIHRYFPVRPVIVDFMYKLPGVRFLMQLINAVPMPDFAGGSNSLKLDKMQEALQEVINGLQKGEVFLFFPAGRVKSTPDEQLGGASGLYRVFQEAENFDIVLVRTTGLWGSHFSRAYSAKTPPIGPLILLGVKTVLKNFLFFTPRRKVTITFEKAPANFPVHGSKTEINQTLEAWYNKEEDRLVKVPYARFGKEPEWPQERKAKAITKSVDPEVKQKVFAKLSQLANVPVAKIHEEMNLSNDLGLDSLNATEISLFLEEQFDVRSFQNREMVTVKDVLKAASEEPLATAAPSISLGNWLNPPKRERCVLEKSDSILEAFSKKADKEPNRPITADLRAGVSTYRDLKLRVLLLKKLFADLPGKSIGILLPNSTAALIAILACQAAGKIPVMVNWTLGPRHLDDVIEAAKLKAIVSSQAFLEQLPNVDFGKAKELLVFLEDFRHKISLADKVKGKILSFFPIASKLKRDDTAVILFTSGSEGSPKGVPLSHGNILSNLDSLVRSIDLWTDDVMFNFLPPFHSYGFTASTLAGPLLGMRSPYFPNPNEPYQLAKGIETFKGTILCGAPTFLKRILKAAAPHQLDTLRLIVTGAEKAPQELYDMAKAHVVEGYGITECSPVLSMNRIGEERKGVGRAIEDVEFAIVHPETYESLPIGKVGLVLARGPNVFSGYLTKNASPFIEFQGKKWYKTGDLGALDEEGRLTLTGRLKRFVKVGGEMISLAGLEEAMSETYTKQEEPQFAVSAQEKEGDRPTFILFTTLPITLEEANQALKNRGVSNLARFSSVHMLSAIPLLGTGKVNYKMLEEETFH